MSVMKELDVIDNKGARIVAGLAMNYSVRQALSTKNQRNIVV